MNSLINFLVININVVCVLLPPSRVTGYVCSLWVFLFCLFVMNDLNVCMVGL